MISEWVVSASADNGIATATRAAEPGREHHMTAVIASYGSTQGGLLTITDGDWTITVEVYDELDMEFRSPVRGREGAALSASLTASGTGGNVGYVNLIGYSV